MALLNLPWAWHGTMSHAGIKRAFGPLTNTQSASMQNLAVQKNSELRAEEIRVCAFLVINQGGGVEESFSRRAWAYCCAFALLGSCARTFSNSLRASG